MSFTDAIRSCLSKYVTFSGRAARSEFWWWTLFVVLGNIGLTLIDGSIFGMTSVDLGQGMTMQQPAGPLADIFALATFLPGVSVTVRRLHDHNRSGWWWWLWLVPLLGWLVLLIGFLRRGTEGPNSYGPDPLDRDEGPMAGSASSIPRVPRS
jgi:uncharacterized membrane protein YhaH (DUF805 family)